MKQFWYGLNSKIVSIFIVVVGLTTACGISDKKVEPFKPSVQIEFDKPIRIDSVNSDNLYAVESSIETEIPQLLRQTTGSSSFCNKANSLKSEIGCDLDGSMCEITILEETSG